MNPTLEEVEPSRADTFTAERLNEMVDYYVGESKRVNKQLAYWLDQKMEYENGREE